MYTPASLYGIDLDVGSAISLLRSASENYQDYIPVLTRGSLD
jgi:hypothetical protein